MFVLLHLNPTSSCVNEFNGTCSGGRVRAAKYSPVGGRMTFAHFWRTMKMDGGSEESVEKKHYTHQQNEIRKMMPTAQNEMSEEQVPAQIIIKSIWLELCFFDTKAPSKYSSVTNLEI
jgi:hypothetical protein